MGGYFCLDAKESARRLLHSAVTRGDVPAKDRGAVQGGDAAVMRRSAMAWAYRKGLSVEPGWRSASTPSTSAASLSSPEEPTQAS